MSIYRSGLAVVLLSAIYALPCRVFAVGEPTYTDVLSCSELTSDVDRKFCSYHLSVLKSLIREKNNQASLATPSSVTPHSISQNASLSITTVTPPISEAVRIRKISATTTRLGHEVFITNNRPTLFIFDAEVLPGLGQPAVYELPLTEAISGISRRVNSFPLPKNSALVGNSINILPEFVIEGGIEIHHVMSATYNDSVYYLANIEIDSRNPLDIDDSTTTTKGHTPGGILDLRGAGIFRADNIRVVLKPADNDMRTKPVELGCTHYADGRGAEEHFIYRFTHSEFDLLRGVKELTHIQRGALNIECNQNTGQVLLTMKNTETVLSVPTKTDAPTPPAPPQSSGVLFSMSLWSRENVLRFIDSTCNSIVDQFGNDLSIDSANPSDPDHYMGGIPGDSNCSDIKMVDGAFGLKDREQAWGWIATDSTAQHSCRVLHKKSYQAGFASVNAWSSAGFDVACNCTMPTSTDSSLIAQAACASPTLIAAPVSKGPLVMNQTDTARLTKGQKWGIGIGALVVDQAITQGWFHFSKRIKQAWVRRTSQALAVALGLGFPVFQLVPRCISGLRGKKASHTLLPAQAMSDLTILDLATE